MFLLLALDWMVLNHSAVRAQPDETAREKFMEVVWSNDFVNQTDRYFSNGFDFALHHPFMKRSPTRFLLLPDWGSGNVYHGLTMVHHFFTPDKLTDSSVVEADRPYASYLLVGHRKTSLYPDRRVKVTSEIRAGILGRYSGGESIQNGIHDLLPASEPATGWGNQLNPDVAVNYVVRVEKGILSTPHSDLIPHAGARAGIPYSDVDAGVYFRFGRISGYFKDLGIRSQPGLTVFLFGDISGRYVAYNATLEGGLLNHGPHTLKNINRWVSEAKAGIAVGIQGFSFEFEQHFLSPEFPGAMPHKWGAFTFRIAL